MSCNAIDHRYLCLDFQTNGWIKHETMANAIISNFPIANFAILYCNILLLYDPCWIYYEIYVKLGHAHTVLILSTGFFTTWLKKWSLELWRNTNKDDIAYVLQSPWMTDAIYLCFNTLGTMCNLRLWCVLTPHIFVKRCTLTDNFLC